MSLKVNCLVNHNGMSCNCFPPIQFQQHQHSSLCEGCVAFTSGLYAERDRLRADVEALKDMETFYKAELIFRKEEKDALKAKAEQAQGIIRNKGIPKYDDSDDYPDSKSAWIGGYEQCIVDMRDALAPEGEKA